MKDIEGIIKDLIDIEEVTEINFKKKYGFYFVFKTTSLIIKDEISSSEIKPIAIIYEENGEYYLAPLDDMGEKDEVVKNFVEKCL